MVGSSVTATSYNLLSEAETEACDCVKQVST